MKRFRFNPSDDKIALAVGPIDGKYIISWHSSLSSVIRGRFLVELYKALKGNRSFDLLLIEREDKDG